LISSKIEFIFWILGNVYYFNALFKQNTSNVCYIFLFI